LGGEPERVAALELLDVGDDPYPLGTVELLELLHDVAEPAKVLLKPGAVAHFAGVQPA
jgi:hypothetical protein